MQIRKTIFTVFSAFALLAGTTTFAQNGSPQRQPSQLDGTRYGVVYDVPATKQVTVRADVPYLKDGRGTLTVDIYSPPDMKAGEKRPAVVFVNAVGDRGDNKVKNWGIYKSWPRLVAAHGLVGISMDADGERIQESLRGVFDFLSKQGGEHGIDGARLGLYAASANVTGTTQYLASEQASKSIRAAALYYGNAPSGTLRTDLPVLFILAEGDAPRMGQAGATLWQRVVEAQAPWTLLYASDLPHAFDAFSDNDNARRVIQQSLAFWKSHLEPVPQPAWQQSAARSVVEALYWNDPQRSADLLANWIKDNPNDAVAHSQLGRMLVALRRFDEAVASYEKAKALDPNEPGNYAGLGQIKYGQRQFDQAIPLLTRAIESGVRHSQIYGQLASSQLHVGQNEEAIKTYEKAFAAGIPPGANTRGVAYYNMACGYARLKQKDKAIETLSKAVAEGFIDRNTYETDEDLNSLRTEPRFQELLARLPKS